MYSSPEEASWALRDRQSFWLKEYSTVFQWKQQPMDSSLVLVFSLWICINDERSRGWLSLPPPETFFFFFRIKNMHHLFCDSFLDAPVQPSTLNPAGLITLTSELSMKLVLRSVTVALILYCLQDWLPHKALSFLSVRLFPAVNYPKT